MKVLNDTPPFETDVFGASPFALPQGIVGFPDYTRAELIYQHEQLPFVWMRLHGAKGSINFVVVEPGGIIPGYEPEIFDNDAAALGLTHHSEALVLAIVTFHNRTPLDATVNLVGPIVINRRTRVGRQVVIANYSRYGARHLLMPNSQAESDRASA